MSVTAVPIAPTKRSYLTWLWLGIATALILGVALAWQGTRPAVAAKGTNAQFLAWNGTRAGVITTASGLQYQIIKPGEGASPTDEDVGYVRYAGRLRDGTVFDAPPQPQPLEVSRVVKGFSEGMKLMKKGAHYRFWIPSELGYGATPAPGSPIPPDAVLVFDVELIDFLPASVIQQMQMQQMLQGGGGAGGPPPAPKGE